MGSSGLAPPGRRTGSPPRRASSSMASGAPPARPDAVRLVAALIQAAKTPLVIDADGITARTRQPEVLSKASVPVILTPHPGELGRLLSVPKEEVIEKQI